MSARLFHFVTSMIVTSTLVASCSGGQGGLVVSPARIARAVSTDVDLCRVTAARVIMDRIDDADGPLLDEELVQAPDEPCVWRSAGERLLPRGRYKLLVRFDAVPREGSACGEDVSVPIGAYLFSEVEFPFAEGFGGIREEDFLSLVEQSVPAEGLVFDPDDDGRDSLAEIAANGDPCTKNEAPIVTVEQLGGTAADEETVSLRVRSAGTTGDLHQLAVTILHDNGAAAGTGQIRFLCGTDPSLPAATVDEAPGGEGWALTVTSGDDDPADGSASYDLSLRLDEPFVGDVTVRVFATLDGVTPIASAAPLALTVSDVEDETLILDEDFQPLDRLDFAEVRSSLGTDVEDPAVRQDLLELATAVRIRVEDEDLDDDVSVLDARLADCPAVTSLVRDTDAFALRWGATNADAVAEALAGGPRTCTLELLDSSPAAVVRGTAAARLFVSPLKNDPPSYQAPNPGSLGLPDAPFAEHVVPFVVVDPDQIETAPTCTPALTPRAGTSCTVAQAFTAVECAPNGLRTGETWPFALVLTPSPSYFTSCGASPFFDVELEIVDVSPDGSDPPLSYSTCQGSTADCGAAFFLRTASVVDAQVLTIGAHDQYDDVAPVIDSVSGLGLMRVPDGAGGKALGLVELVGPQAPRVVSVSPPDVALTFEETNPGRRGAGAGGRFVTAVRDGGGTQVIVQVDASNGAAQATYSSLTLQSQCQESFNGTLGAFLVDRAGNLYLTCNGDTDSTPPARLVRFAPDGTRSDVPLNGRVTPSGFFEGEQINVVVDPVDEREWIVWPDDEGFVLVDTASIGGTLATERIAFAWPGNGSSNLDAFAFDPSRGLFLFLYETDQNGDGFINDSDNQEAALSAILFDGSPALYPATLVLPEASARDNNGFSFARLMVRPFDAARPLAEPDLLVQPGFGDFPRIDLDGPEGPTSFSVTGFLDDVELPSFGTDVFASPDRRFTISPTGCDGPDSGVSLALFPWDGGATQLLSFGVDCADNQNPDAFAVNDAAAVATFIDGNGDLWVFDFVEARAGLD